MPIYPTELSNVSNIGFNRRMMLLGAAGLSFTAALGLPRAVRASGERIGFTMEGFGQPRWKNLDQPCFESAVASAGFQPIVNQANYDVAQQLKDVENFISQGVKALVIVAVNEQAGVNMVRKAKGAGIPVVAYNQAIPSADVAAYVARDNRRVGRQAVDAAQGAVGLEGKFVIVSGHPGNTVAEECTAGYLEVLQPLIDSGKVEIVSHQFNRNWDPELARQQAENALTANGNGIRGFFCNNDGMAGGVIQALAAQGLAGRVFVSGQDATTEACRNMLLGRMMVSNFTRFDTMGATAGELAVKLAMGEAVEAPMTYLVKGEIEVPMFPIEDVNVSLENMAEYFEQYSPGYIDAKAVLQGLDDDAVPEVLRKFRRQT